MNQDDPIFAPPTDSEVEAFLKNPRFLEEMGIEYVGESHSCPRCADFPDTLNDLAVTRAELKGNQRRVTIFASATFFLGTALAAMIAARLWR